MNFFTTSNKQESVAFNYTFIFNLDKALDGRVLKDLSDSNYTKLCKDFASKANLDEEEVDVFMGLCSSHLNKNYAVKILDTYCKTTGTDASDVDEVMNFAIKIFMNRFSEYLTSATETKAANADKEAQKIELGLEFEEAIRDLCPDFKSFAMAKATNGITLHLPKGSVTVVVAQDGLALAVKKAAYGTKALNDLLSNVEQLDNICRDFLDELKAIK